MPDSINETQKNYQGVVTDNWRPIEFDHVFQFGLENTKGNASQLEVFEETKIFAELSVQGLCLRRRAAHMPQCFVALSAHECVRVGRGERCRGAALCSRHGAPDCFPIVFL